MGDYLRELAARGREIRKMPRQERSAFLKKPTVEALEMIIGLSMEGDKTGLRQIAVNIKVHPDVRELARNCLEEIVLHEGLQ